MDADIVPIRRYELARINTVSMNPNKYYNYTEHTRERVRLNSKRLY
jgi:hypothetical protein